MRKSEAETERTDEVEKGRKPVNFSGGKRAVKLKKKQRTDEKK